MNTTSILILNGIVAVPLIALIIANDFSREHSHGYLRGAAVEGRAQDATALILNCDQSSGGNIGRCGNV